MLHFAVKDEIIFINLYEAAIDILNLKVFHLHIP